MADSNRTWALLTEATAIVASILLAFAIDAWWDTRNDREAEQSAIGRLIVEFEQNLTELAAVGLSAQDTLNATERLLAMTGPDQQGLMDTRDIGRTLNDCLTNPTFDPRLGTTNSLIASGNLHLIRDQQLQSMLTEWPAAAQNLIRWQDIERMHGEEIILPFTYDYVAWPDVDSALGFSKEASRFESDYKGLFSSLRLEGLLNNRHYNLRDMISTIDELEIRTQQLIERLKDQRKSSN
jgi:hypothetical protein